MPIFKLIAAMDRNRVIGNHDRLPWHLPEELQWFKQVTLGGTLLMGRRTMESIGRALPGRTTYVLTHQSVAYPGATTIHCLEDLPSDVQSVWVCGGAQVYAQCLPLCSELILSIVQAPFKGDAFFPPFKHWFRCVEILKTTPAFEVQRWIPKVLPM